MSENKPAVNTDPAAAPDKPVTPAVDNNVEDLEEKIATLEAEKAKAIEEASNWKVAALKFKGKENPEDESEEDRVARIVAQQLSEKRVAAIDAEKDTLLKQLAKENRELKLAQLNKPNTPPAADGTHNEGQKPQDTEITAEQLAAFRARGWTDSDIDRYRKNLKKYGGR